MQSNPGALSNLNNQDSGSFGLEIANNYSFNDNDIHAPMTKRRRLEIEEDINEFDKN